MPTKQLIPLLASKYNKDSMKDASVADLVNFYLESIPDYGNGRKIAAVGTPGSKLWLDLDGDVGRAGFEHKGIGYVVVDDTVYSVTSGGAPTQLGTLTTTTGRVSIAAIDDEIVFADGAKVYSYQVSNDDWAEVTDADLPADVSIVLASNSCFFYLKPSSQTVYVSDVGDGRSISAISTLSAEVDFDQLITGGTANSIIYLIGEHTTETWFASGNDTVPFDRTSQGVVPFGTPAKYTPINIMGDLYFLGQTQRGIVGMVKVTNQQYTVIDNMDFVEKVNNYETISDAFTWCDTHNGHTFLNITFPSAEAARGRTLTYDITMGVWLERESLYINSPIGPIQSRHFANWHIFLGGKQLVGDYLSGKIYELKSTYYDEDGTVITRRIRSPHMMNNDMYFSVYDLEIMFEGGVALSSGQGSDPQVRIRYSKDRGHTWSNFRLLSIGQTGQYGRKVRLASTGGGYSHATEIQVSDPVSWTVLGATARIEAAQF